MIESGQPPAFGGENVERAGSETNQRNPASGAPSAITPVRVVRELESTPHPSAENGRVRA